MAARRTFSIWDDVWLGETDGTAHEVPFPARLASGLTPLERYRRWRLRNRELRTAMLAGAMFLGFGAFLAVLLRCKPEVMAAFALPASLVCVLTMWLWMAAASRADGRVVAAVRQRTRILRDEKMRAGEVAERCAYWKMRILRARQSPAGQRLLLRSVWWRLLLCGYFAGMFAVMFIDDLAKMILPWKVSFPGSLYIGPAIVMFSIVSGRVWKSVKSRMVAAAAQEACGDCAYPLEPGEHGIGPERCPECGSPWPLVPPPIPGPQTKPWWWTSVT